MTNNRAYQQVLYILAYSPNPSPGPNYGAAYREFAAGSTEPHAFVSLVRFFQYLTTVRNMLGVLSQKISLRLRVVSSCTLPGRLTLRICDFSDAYLATERAHCLFWRKSVTTCKFRLSRHALHGKARVGALLRFATAH